MTLSLGIYYEKVLIVIKLLSLVYDVSIDETNDEKMLLQ